MQRNIPFINSFYSLRIYLALGCTSLDQQNIAILHHILLAFGHDLSGSLGGGFVAVFLQCVIVVNNGLNEGLFEIRVDDTSSGWSLHAFPDGPLSDFIRTSGEEAVQVQDLTHGGDHLGQTSLSSQLLALFFGSSLIAHLGEALLKRGRDGKKRIARGVGLDPFHNLGQVLVLLTDVVSLAQVDQVHNGLGREKEERVNDLNLLIISIMKSQNDQETMDNKCNIRRDIIS